MKFTLDFVKKIAGLAHIPISDAEAQKLAQGFTATLSVVDQLQKVQITDVPPAHQVTGLENVLRDDVVDESRMFSQEQALSNAKRTHAGYFVVDQIMDQE